MSAADYYLCDVCGDKTFYDAGLDYDKDGLVRVGAMVVLCEFCSKKYEIHIVSKDVGEIS